MHILLNNYIFYELDTSSQFTTSSISRWNHAVILKTFCWLFKPLEETSLNYSMRFFKMLIALSNISTLSKRHWILQWKTSKPVFSSLKHFSNSEYSSVIKHSKDNWPQLMPKILETCLVRIFLVHPSAMLEVLQAPNRCSNLESSSLEPLVAKCLFTHLNSIYLLQIRSLVMTMTRRSLSLFSLIKVDPWWKTRSEEFATVLLEMSLILRLSHWTLKSKALFSIKWSSRISLDRLSSSTKNFWSMLIQNNKLIYPYSSFTSCISWEKRLFTHISICFKDKEPFSKVLFGVQNPMISKLQSIIS